MTVLRRDGSTTAALPRRGSRRKCCRRGLRIPFCVYRAAQVVSGHPDKRSQHDVELHIFASAILRQGVPHYHEKGFGYHFSCVRVLRHMDIHMLLDLLLATMSCRGFGQNGATMAQPESKGSLPVAFARRLSRVVLEFEIVSVSWHGCSCKLFFCTARSRVHSVLLLMNVFPISNVSRPFPLTPIFSPRSAVHVPRAIPT